MTDPVTDPVVEAEPIATVRAEWRTPALAWLAVATIGNLIQNLAVRAAGAGIRFVDLLPWFSPTTGKGGWDSIYYINIAERGYTLPPGQTFTTRPAADLVAYFPGYPLAIRMVAWMPGIEPPLASVLVAMVGGLAATVLFWRWTGRRSMTPTARRSALAIFLLFPYAFTLIGVAYAEPLTLAFVLGAFVLLDDDRHIAAGLVGALATFTRPTALPLIVALPLAALAGHSIRDGWQPFVARLRERWGTLLASLGVGVYMVWLAVTYGDPFKFWTVQEHYGQGSAASVRTWIKLDFLESLPDLGLDAESVNRVAAALLTVLAACSVPAIAKRFGAGYAAFTAGIVATILLGARLFSPGGRYLVLAFPVVAVCGDALARRTVARNIVIAVLGAGWVLLLVRFARTESLAW